MREETPAFSVITPWIKKKEQVYRDCRAKKLFLARVCYKAALV